MYAMSTTDDDNTEPMTLSSEDIRSVVFHIRWPVWTLLVAYTLVLAIGIVVILFAGEQHTLLTAGVLITALAAAHLLWTAITGYLETSLASSVLSHLNSPSQLRSTRAVLDCWYAVGWALAAADALVIVFVVIAVLEVSSKDHATTGLLGGGAIITGLAMALQCCTGQRVLRHRFIKTVAPSSQSSTDAIQMKFSLALDRAVRLLLCLVCKPGYCCEPMEEDAVARLSHTTAQVYAELNQSGATYTDILNGFALLADKPREVWPAAQPLEAGDVARLPLSERMAVLSIIVYTGPMLDMGRNAAIGGCQWLWRQGWCCNCACSRSTEVAVDGDNCICGHARAFARDLPSGVELYCGQVCQHVNTDIAAERERLVTAFFVTIDKEHREVVICVRGTESINDMLIDALASPSPLVPSDGLEDGFAHTGALSAARALMGQLTELDVLNLVGESSPYAGFKLLLTGHSLAGAVVALLAAAIRHRGFANVTAFAFCPMPVLSHQAALSCAGYVLSYIHNDDIASRLSVSSMARLCRRAKAASDQHAPHAGCCERGWCRWAGARAWDCVCHGRYGATLPEPDDTPEDPSVPIDMSDTPLSPGSGDQLEDEELYVAGRVVHLRLQNPASGRHREVAQVEHREYAAVVACQECFRDILMTPDMFLDHLPWRYVHAIRSLRGHPVTAYGTSAVSGVVSTSTGAPTGSGSAGGVRQEELFVSQEEKPEEYETRGVSYV